MAEEIIQGGESPANIAARRAAWLARDTDQAKTPLQIQDVERLLLAHVSGIDRAVIDQVKRSRTGLA